MNTNQHTLPWGLSWTTVVLAVLTLGTFLAVSGPTAHYITPMMGGGVREYTNSGSVSTGVAVPPTAVGAPMMDGSVSSGATKDMMYPYPYPYPTDTPVTDMREFLKIYYSASMRSRDVPALTRRVETTVRGYSGRIDQESSSSEYGSVSFALPESKYDAFRAELEGLVGSRFLTVNISSQNMLSQKVSIEDQQKQAKAMLADYQSARTKVVSAHASAVQSLQAKIDASAPQSAERLLFEKQLASENSSYTTQLANADANIKYAQDLIKAVETQDQTLLDNVATVTGTVSIQWISLWDIALTYLPGYWIPFFFALLTVISYSRDRRRAP